MRPKFRPVLEFPHLCFSIIVWKCSSWVIHNTKSFASIILTIIPDCGWSPHSFQREMNENIQKYR